MNTLLYSMGAEAEAIVRSRNLSDAQLKVYDTVKKEINDHFVPKRNVIFERARFNKRIQENGESVDKFIIALHELSAYCDYGRLREQLIRDRIVVGLRDRSLSEKTQMDANLTLETAKLLAIQKETIKKQQSLLGDESESGQMVEAVGYSRTP